MKQRIFPLATLAAVFASLPVQAETGVNEFDVNYSPRIVGGTDAVAQDWQFFTQIVSRNGNRPFCGASYLGEGYVLTAAHCVDNDRPSDIAVKIGAHQYNGHDGIRAEISQIHIHPQYRRATLTNDIAVLKLTSNVIAPTVEIAAGSLSQYVSIGDDLRVAGVGRLFENGTSPTILQEVTVPLVSDAVCQQGGGSYQNVGLDNFCAGYAQGQKDSCQGDSGGPIIVKRNGQITQLGIVSWGIGCARPNQYGVYSDIAALRDWVDTVISGTDTPVALSYEKQVVLPDFHVGELRQHEFKFTNTGVAPISISEAIAKSTGVTDAAVVASDTCSVATLTQNQSCAVRVEFGASAAGQAGVTVTLLADQIQGPVEAHATATALDKNGGGQYDFIYPNGLGQYRPGTIVLAADGQRYQCRPYPSSQWCNFGGAYAPGTGWASKDAWLAL